MGVLAHEKKHTSFQLCQSASMGVVSTIPLNSSNATNEAGLAAAAISLDVQSLSRAYGITPSQLSDTALLAMQANLLCQSLCWDKHAFYWSIKWTRIDEGSLGSSIVVSLPYTD